MPTERNGIVLFDLNEKYADHPVTRKLQGVDLGDVRFPFGFYVVEENGKKIVLPGTREDLVKHVLKAFPDYPKELFGLIGSTGVCRGSTDGCEGGCRGFPTGYACVRLGDPTDGFFGCDCVDKS
jgi:hypothetical protein